MPATSNITNAVSACTMRWKVHGASIQSIARPKMARPTRFTGAGKKRRNSPSLLDDGGTRSANENE